MPTTSKDSTRPLKSRTSGQSAPAGGEKSGHGERCPKCAENSFPPAGVERVLIACPRRKT
jgi:hypothetical protein